METNRIGRPERLSAVNSLQDKDLFPAAAVFTVRTAAAPLVTANLMPALRDLCNGEPSGMKKTMRWSPEGVALRNIGLARWVASKQEWVATTAGWQYMNRHDHNPEPEAA